VSDSPAPKSGVTREKVAQHVLSTVERRVRWACVLSLVALGLITWALISRRPLPVIAAMSIGQLLGTLSLLLFLTSIALDLRAGYKVSKKGILPESERPRSPEEDGGK
jgi:hypothetical protein